MERSRKLEFSALLRCGERTRIRFTSLFFSGANWRLVDITLARAHLGFRKSDLYLYLSLRPIYQFVFRVVSERILLAQLCGDALERAGQVFCSVSALEVTGGLIRQQAQVKCATLVSFARRFAALRDV